MGLNNTDEVKRSVQAATNQSFDETFQQNTVEILGYDSANNVLRRVRVDNNGFIAVDITQDLPTAVVTGQAKVAVTGTAVQFAANVLTQGVIISAKPTNAAVVTIGGSTVNNTVNGTGNGLILPPGGSVSYAGTNTNQLYVNGTAGDIISFIGS